MRKFCEQFRDVNAPVVTSRRPSSHYSVSVTTTSVTILAFVASLLIVAIARVASGQTPPSSSTICTCYSAANQAALDAFRIATSGDSWTRDPWPPSSNMCHWSGVGCGGTDVTSIIVPRRGLRGSLPDILAQFTAMQNFDVSSNFLTGSLPSQLSSWTNVSVFQVSANSLSGSLPDSYGQSWKSIANFSVSLNALTGGLPSSYGNWGATLLFFDAGSNQLTGSIPPSYASWVHLEVLYMYLNSLSGSLVESFSSWSAITVIRLDRNKLSGSLPSSFSAWRRMQQLEASYNQFTGQLPSSYADWTNMEVFSVGGNQFDGTLPPEFGVGWRDTLIRFSVFGDESSTISTGSRITGSLPVEYRQWREIVSFDTRLQRIDGTLPPQYSDWNRTIEVFLVGYNSLSGTLPESYASWSKMSNFAVDINSLSGTLPASYGAGWGTSLLGVQFSQNSFTGSLPAEAYAHWTNITLFAASINKLTGTIPDAYGSAWNRTITAFYCAENQLNGTLPDSFRLWSRISIFAVGTNNLTGTLPQSYGLGWGDSISYFEAPKNELNGTIPSSYGTYWRNMSHIALTQNKLSGTLPPTLVRWTKLSFLYLRDNLLEGTLPTEFGAAWSSSISQVNLASNFFEGSLPQEYSAWTSLTFLDCGNNQLNGSLSSSFGLAWGPTITSFTATNNRFTGSIPSSFIAWTSIGRFAADGNSLTGTIPVYIPTAWSQLTLLYLRSNRLSGTIHNNFDQLRQLNQLYLNCNDLDGTLPSTFRTMTALQYLTVSGNPKLSGSLPATWGTAGASLSLRLLSLQNTSLFGTLPTSWSTSSSSLISLGSFLTVCHTQLCGGAPPGGISVFVLQLCLQDDDSLCAMPDVAALAPKAASFPVSSLPPCSASTGAPPTTAPPSRGPRWQNATTIKFTGAQTAVAIIGGPVAAVAALAASTSAGLGTVRAGAVMRLVACGGATNDDTHDDDEVNELALLGGGYLAGFLGVCILLGVLVAWRVYTKKDALNSPASSSSSFWSATTMHLRLPGRAWGIVSGVVPSLVEYGLGLLVAAHSDPGLVVLGTVSLACSLLTCAWVWTVVTCRFDNVVWQRTDLLRRRTTTTPTTPTATTRASPTAAHSGGSSISSNHLLHRSNHNNMNVISVLVHRLQDRMEEYTRQRSHGTWMDAHRHRGKKHNVGESGSSSFVATHGAVFEDYCEGRVWFVVWESALAVAVSVLSAVAGAATGSCNSLQIVGAVLQMAGLVMLVVARPHREARALCVGVAMEVLGFVGGLCLLVSAAAFPDDDNNSWSTAASDVLQAQFYVGAALVVVDGLYSRRIINALRSFFDVSIAADQTATVQGDRTDDVPLLHSQQRLLVSPLPTTARHSTVALLPPSKLLQQQSHHPNISVNSNHQLERLIATICKSSRSHGGREEH